MQKISDNIHYILEEFMKKHSIIEELPDRKEIHNKISSTNLRLKAMSPKGLYRKKGLNITGYQKIMKKYSLANTSSTNAKKPGASYSFTK